MNSFRADLHMHSTCSDGTYTPKELLRHAKKSGLAAVSITDHDTVEAYREAEQSAQETGIEIVSGIELSTELNGTSVHILGYAFNWKHPAIQQLCSRHQTRREQRNKEILKLLGQHGMLITKEDLAAQSPQGKASVGRPHIAKALLAKGYVANIKEAFHHYIGENKRCYVPGEKIDLDTTVSTIRKAHGLAVIAHPHLIKEKEVLRSLLKKDFDGIECYYARFPKEQEARWHKIAQRKNWLVTGGSDFHGSVKPTIPIGCSWVPEETFRILQARYQEAMARDA